MNAIDTERTRERIEAFQRKHRIGFLTLVFTDIIDSTKLKESLGDRAAVPLIQKHHQAIREILSGFPESEEIETAGDSFFIVFTKPSDAVRFALFVQARLHADAELSGHPIRDRIGLHVGEVWIEERSEGPKRKDLYGLQVDSCARVAALGGADQILMTRAPFDSARQVLKNEMLEGIGPLSWLNYGPYSMKGVEEPIEVCEVGEIGRAPLTPPSGNEKARRVVSLESEPVLGWRPALDQQVPGTSWVLEEKLGEGGFGEVWLGRDKVLKTQHVFKFCFRADRVRALKREVTVFRLIRQRVANHPNIVGIEATYFDEPPFYVVMQYVAGRDLSGWCKEEGGVDKVPLATRLEIVAQVADALQAAHDSGIIHRDVKPSNILVSGNDTAAHAYLTDFGIGQVVSKEILAGLSAPGFTGTAADSASQSGTHLYMAPEVLAGKAASTRSDIYALGVVLYQILVADFSCPFTGDWARRISNPLLREDLEKCFAGDPQDRFAGAGQLAENLRALEKRQSALAEEQSALQAREQAAYRSGLLRAAAIAAVLLSLFAILALSAFRSATDAQRERDRAKSLVRQAAQSDLGNALRLIDQDETSAALCYLARALTFDQDLRLAATEFAALFLNEVSIEPPLPDEAFDVREQNANFPEKIQALALHPDGHHLAFADREHGVRIRKVSDGEVTASYKPPEGYVEELIFSPDGRWLSWRGTYLPLEVRDARNLEAVALDLEPSLAITGFSFSPNGELGCVFENPRELRIVPIGQPNVKAWTLSHPSNVRQIEWSPDSRQLAILGNDGRVLLWSVTDRKAIMPALAMAGPVVRVHFSPDSLRIAATTGLREMAVWELQGSKPLGPTTVSLNTAIEDSPTQQPTPDEEQDTSDDGNAQDPPPAAANPTEDDSHSVIEDFVFAPAGTLIWTLAQPLDDPKAGKLLESWSISEKTRASRTVVESDKYEGYHLSPRGDVLFKRQSNGRMELFWLGATGDVQEQNFTRVPGERWSLDPQGRYLAAGLSLGQAALWDLEQALTPSSLPDPPIDHQSGLVSPDGECAIAFEGKLGLHLKDIASGLPLATKLSESSNEKQNRGHLDWYAWDADSHRVLRDSPTGWETIAYRLAPRIGEPWLDDLALAVTGNSLSTDGSFVRHSFTDALKARNRLSERILNQDKQGISDPEWRALVEWWLTRPVRRPRWPKAGARTKPPAPPLSTPLPAASTGITKEEEQETAATGVTDDEERETVALGGTQDAGGYLTRLHDTIYSCWRTPKPDRLKVEDTDFAVTAEVGLAKDGKIVSRRIVVSSGNKIVDDSVLEAMSLAQFDAVPDPVSKHGINFTFRFVFSNGGSVARDENSVK